MTAIPQMKLLLHWLLRWAQQSCFCKAGTASDQNQARLSPLSVASLITLCTVLVAVIKKIQISHVLYGVRARSVQVFFLFFLGYFKRVKEFSAVTEEKSKSSLYNSRAVWNSPNNLFIHTLSARPSSVRDLGFTLITPTFKLIMIWGWDWHGLHWRGEPRGNATWEWRRCPPLLCHTLVMPTLQMSWEPVTAVRRLRVKGSRHLRKPNPSVKPGKGLCTFDKVLKTFLLPHPHPPHPQKTHLRVGQPSKVFTFQEPIVCLHVTKSVLHLHVQRFLQQKKWCEIIAFAICTNFPPVKVIKEWGCEGGIDVIIKCRCKNLGPNAWSCGPTEVMVLWWKRGWRNTQGRKGGEKKKPRTDAKSWTLKWERKQSKGGMFWREEMHFSSRDVQD